MLALGCSGRRQPTNHEPGFRTFNVVGLLLVKWVMGCYVASMFDCHPVHLVSKRVLDVCIALVALLGFLILLPFLALLIVLASPGPVFFRQERVGQYGRPFTMLKLRSMHCNVEQYTHGLNKPKHDPRIHWAGHFLRKTSLDELPQFVNVLRGDMSVVGPRPFVPADASRLSQERLRARPGITGPWQVSDRSETSWEATTRLDHDYVMGYRFWTDLRIMAQTPRAMLKGR
jgi:lipopolysaccharide/colanic/teichoic acid biosynthesis glycosyltransferase